MEDYDLGYRERAADVRSALNTKSQEFFKGHMEALRDNLAGKTFNAVREGLASFCSNLTYKSEEDLACTGMARCLVNLC